MVQKILIDQNSLSEFDHIFPCQMSSTKTKNTHRVINIRSCHKNTDIYII